MSTPAAQQQPQPSGSRTAGGGGEGLGREVEGWRDRKRRRTPKPHCPHHLYPRHDIPQGTVLLWRPSAQVGHYSCQYRGCQATFTSQNGALYHGRTAHPPVAEAKLHSGLVPLSDEGKKEWQRHQSSQRSAKYYQVWWKCMRTSGKRSPVGVTYHRSPFIYGIIVITIIIIIIIVIIIISSSHHRLSLPPRLPLLPPSVILATPLTLSHFSPIPLPRYNQGP